MSNMELSNMASRSGRAVDEDKGAEGEYEVIHDPTYLLPTPARGGVYSIPEPTTTGTDGPYTALSARSEPSRTTQARSETSRTTQDSRQTSRTTHDSS
jgi:hypothetical protein